MKNKNSRIKKNFWKLKRWQKQKFNTTGISKKVNQKGKEYKRINNATNKEFQKEKTQKTKGKKLIKKNIKAKNI